MSEYLIQLASTAPVSADNPIRPRLLVAFHASVDTLVDAAANGVGIDPFKRVTQLVLAMREALAIADRRTAEAAKPEASYPTHEVADVLHAIAQAKG